MFVLKRGRFLLVFALLLLCLPLVSAVVFTPLDLYYDYYGWLDFFVAFLVLSLLFDVALKPLVGGDGKTSKNLAFALGLVCSLALVTWEIYQGFSLFSIGPFVLVFLGIIAVGFLYHLVKDKTHGSGMYLIGILLAALLVGYLWYPQLFYWIPIPAEFLLPVALLLGLLLLIHILRGTKDRVAAYGAGEDGAKEGFWHGLGRLSSSGKDKGVGAAKWTGDKGWGAAKWTGDKGWGAAKGVGGLGWGAAKGLGGLALWPFKKFGGLFRSTPRASFTVILHHEPAIDPVRISASPTLRLIAHVQGGEPGRIYQFKWRVKNYPQRFAGPNLDSITLDLARYGLRPGQRMNLGLEVTCTDTETGAKASSGVHGVQIVNDTVAPILPEPEEVKPEDEGLNWWERLKRKWRRGKDEDAELGEAARATSVRIVAARSDWKEFKIKVRKDKNFVQVPANTELTFSALFGSSVVSSGWSIVPGYVSFDHISVRPSARGVLTTFSTPPLDSNLYTVAVAGYDDAGERVNYDLIFVEVVGEGVSPEEPEADGPPTLPKDFKFRFLKNKSSGISTPSWRTPYEFRISFADFHSSVPLHLGLQLQKKDFIPYQLSLLFRSQDGTTLFPGMFMEDDGSYLFDLSQLRRHFSSEYPPAFGKPYLFFFKVFAPDADVEYDRSILSSEDYFLSILAETSDEATPLPVVHLDMPAEVTAGGPVVARLEPGEVADRVDRIVWHVRPAKKKKGWWPFGGKRP